MFNKLNLQTNDRVKLVKLGFNPLNEREGTIIGVATRHIVDCYIVLLDEVYVTSDFIHQAVSIPECCLERIK